MLRDEDWWAPVLVDEGTWDRRALPIALILFFAADRTGGGGDSFFTYAPRFFDCVGPQGAPEEKIARAQKVLDDAKAAAKK